MYSRLVCSKVPVCGKKPTYKRKKRQVVDGDKALTTSLRLQKMA